MDIPAHTIYEIIKDILNQFIIKMQTEFCIEILNLKIFYLMIIINKSKRIFDLQEYFDFKYKNIHIK